MLTASGGDDKVRVWDAGTGMYLVTAVHRHVAKVQSPVEKERCVATVGFSTDAGPSPPAGGIG